MPRHDGSKRRVSRTRRRSSNAAEHRRRSRNTKSKRRAQPNTRTLDRLLDVITPPAPEAEP